MKKILFSVLMVALSLPLFAAGELLDPGHPQNPGQYQVTLNVNSDQGSVTGAGKYAQGASVTIEATAKTGYEFVRWANGSTTVSTDNPYTFTLKKDVSLTAEFQLLTYTVIWKNEDGTTLETDENVAYGATPAYNGATPTKASTAQYSYTFAGWTPAISSVTGDVTYTATFTPSLRSYTVIWKNEDGTTLETDENVAYGATPAYNGATPTKASTAQYSYTFAGWTPAISSVTGDVTYTATFTPSLRSYTVIWKNEDGTTLETDENVVYGATPAYNGATPTKASTAQYSYTFAGWTPAISSVTGDVTYTATFTPSLRSYTVIWKNEDGTTLETDENVLYGATPAYNGATPTKASDAQYSYTFAGWTPAISSVTGDAMYTATFTSHTKSYTVSFNANGYGTAPADQTIEYGQKATKPADLSVTGYTFGGWYKEQACTNAWNFSTDVVTADVELFAKWTINSHTLTWVADGGTITSTNHTAAGTVVFGTTLVAPTIEKEGYTFEGWNPEVPATMPDEDVTYTATWAAAGDTHYTVKHFQQNIADDEYTEVVADREDKTGETGSNTAAIAKNYEGFNAKSFSQAVIAANGSTVVEIYYDRKLFTVKFVVEGVEKQSSDWRYGATPSYSGATPTKAATTLYNYEFAGWDPAIATVTAAATYTATFNSVAIVEDQVVIEGEKNAEDLPIGATTEIIVTATGHLYVNAELTAKSLTLQYGTSSRAQVTGIDDLHVNTMDVELTLPALAGGNEGHWFAFGVPFEVNMDGGIHVGAVATPARSAYEFYIDEYDGAARAEDQEGWKRVANDGTLVPGKMYMLYVGTSTTGAWRFTAADASAVSETAAVDVAANVSEAGDHHSGWNGVANTLFENAVGDIDDLLLATIYDNANSTYLTTSINHQLAPAEPFFVQAVKDDQLSFSNVSASPVARRMMATEPLAICMVTLSDEAFSYTDYAYISVTDQKEGTYHIGRDLVKMQAMTATPAVPQLWLEAYDLQLAAYEAMVATNELIVPVGMYAPAEGSYIFAMSELPSEVSVYLTKDGQPIWDMTKSAAVLDLTEGNNEGYALVARRVKDIETGLDMPEGVSGLQKLLIDDQLYIIRNGKAYSVTGVQVK